MKTTTKLLAAKVLCELLNRDFPRRILSGEEYAIVPRTYWGSLGITPRQVDRIYHLLKKLGVIKTVVKQYNGKPTLHVHILTQSMNIVESLGTKSCSKSTGNTKRSKNYINHGFHRDSNRENGENHKPHGFHHNNNQQKSEKPEKSKFSPKAGYIDNNNSINNNSYIRERINERETRPQQNPEIDKLREKLLKAGLPEGAINYTLKKAQRNEWLFKNLECLVYSQYFVSVRSKLGIILALAQNPGKYNYLGLKTAGEARKDTVKKPDSEEKARPVIELTDEQVRHLATLREILEKSLTKEKVIDFVLKKAVINKQSLGKLIEYTKTDYFARKVRNKSAFMIAFLDDPDRFEMPVVKQDKRASSQGKGRSKKPIKEKARIEERSADEYSGLEKLFKDAMRSDNESIDDVLDFLGIPKPKTA